MLVVKYNVKKNQTQQRMNRRDYIQIVIET